MDLRAGQIVGRYVLERCIGSGGMGTVWAAHATLDGTAVALKILREREDSSEARARLRREARATTAVADPALVPVQEIFDCDGRPVLVLERRTGEKPRARPARGKGLS